MMTTPASQPSLDRADEPMNNDDAPFECVERAQRPLRSAQHLVLWRLRRESTWRCLQSREPDWRRRSEITLQFANSRSAARPLLALTPADSSVDEDEDPTQSGATTPGGQFRGGSLESFSGLPRRDYAGDQRQTQESTDATAQYKAEWARNGVPGGDGLAVNEPQSTRRYSETDPNQIGA